MTALSDLPRAASATDHYLLAIAERLDLLIMQVEELVESDREEQPESDEIHCFDDPAQAIVPIQER